MLKYKPKYKKVGVYIYIYIYVYGKSRMGSMVYINVFERRFFVRKKCHVFPDFSLIKGLPSKRQTSLSVMSLVVHQPFIVLPERSVTKQKKFPLRAENSSSSCMRQISKLLLLHHHVCDKYRN